MAEDAEISPRGTKPWLRVLLVLSLALNLLIIGTVAGAMFTWSNWKSHHSARLDATAGPLTRALSREDRRAIGKEMRAAHRAGKFTQRDHRAELEGLIADLKAEPFDPAPVSERLSRHRAAFEERLELGMGLLLNRLEQMQPDERAAYADRLQEVLSKRHRHKPSSEE